MFASGASPVPTARIPGLGRFPATEVAGCCRASLRDAGRPRLTRFAFIFSSDAPRYDGIQRLNRPGAPPETQYLFCEWTAMGWLSPHVSIRFVELFCLSKLLSRKQNSTFPAYNFCSRFC
jgi:hypothetical protein